MVMLVVAFVSFSLFNFVGDPINNMVVKKLQMKIEQSLEKLWD